ncbi:unnamed protein product [Adineta steineri]|uniref:Uncharacterized protein n=1 Tax=Adineta steineri TaxID=433720 RepID=A0A815R339_9BILA|nr:unnamed protein product [Adineta steineri]CAF3873981.1 unnamed protein product [Adineta steineri]
MEKYSVHDMSNGVESACLPKKLTVSYVHNASSRPLVYGTIAQSFDKLARQYPDYECYIFKEEEKKYTYASLKYEIDCMSLALLELGFKKNDRLLVALPNCSESAVLTHVASKLGLIKVHVNPDAVACEITSTLTKLECQGIVMVSNDTTTETLREAIPDFNQESSSSIPSLKHIILTGSNISNAHSYNDLMKKGENKKTKEQEEILYKKQESIDPDSPLAIIMTSGSTDEPKPVTLTNFGVLNTILSHLDYFGSSFSHPCGAQVMFHISTGIWTILIMAVNKCTVTIPSLTYNVTSVMQAIDEEKCTSMIVSPIVFRDMLADSQRSNYDFSSLKYVGIGATSVPAKLLRKIETELGIDRVGQAYGLSESGCLLTMSLHCEDKRRHTSIGQCMPHMELKLVDDNGQIVPIGSQGEIWARGYSIMSGYYNDPETTAETITNAGWLKTGDLATMDEDGYLFFAGRKKHIIITGTGRNISPTEIEHAIEDHESIDEAQVFSIPDPRLGEIICAFAKLNNGMHCEVDELKQFLADKLTDYKIPEHICFVDKFPRTALGKVTKFKLAEEMQNILKQ